MAPSPQSAAELDSLEERLSHRAEARAAKAKRQIIQQDIASRQPALPQNLFLAGFPRAGINPIPLTPTMKMMSCLLLISIGLLAGCSSFDPRQTPSAKGVWEFGSLVGETPGTFRIHRGTSRAEIINLLGEPKSKGSLGTDGTKEEWNYVRLTESGYESRGMSSGGQNISLRQRARWVETSRITFVGDVVHDVSIRREALIKREGNTPY